MSESLSPAATPPTPEAGSSRLDERYGTGRRTRIDRRFGWGVVIALLLGGLVFLLWSGWQETGQVQTQNVGFEKVNDREVNVKFSVTAPAKASVACAVEALSTSKAVVGWRIIELPVSENRSHTISTSLLTTTPATAAHARECWIVEPANN